MQLSRITVATLIGIRLLAVVLITMKADDVAAHGNPLGIDMFLYHRLATSEGTPYRDFDVEFPPVTLGELRLIRGSTSQQTGVDLAWTQLGFDLLTIAVISMVWGIAARNAYLLLTVPFVPFMFLQVDPLVVALAVCALALVERQRERAGGVMLALSAFAKIWPIVLIPLLAARGKWRAAGSAVAAGAVGLGAWMVWAGPDAPIRFFRFLSDSGWEIGSGIGTIVGIFTHDPIRVAAGTNRVGTVPVWASVSLFALVIAAALAVAQLVRRGASWPIAAYTAVGVMMLLSPIYSPQYVLWLIPFAAISNNRRLQIATAAVVLGAFGAFLYINAIGAKEGLVLDSLLALKNIVTLGVVSYSTALLLRQSQEARRRGTPVSVPA